MRVWQYGGYRLPILKCGDLRRKILFNVLFVLGCGGRLSLRDGAHLYEGLVAGPSRGVHE